LGYPVASLWWIIRRPNYEGTLIAVRVGSGLLLLRSSYRREWNFPGGGILTDESAETAARRELKEELGISIGTLVPRSTVTGVWKGRQEKVHFFEIVVEELPEIKIDNREILEARVYNRDELPAIKLTGPVKKFACGEGWIPNTGS